VLGVIPTPLDQVTEAVGLNPVINIGNLPEDIAAKKPKAMSRVLGAIIFPTKTAYVDLSQQKPRARLTHAHEIGHKILPWHEDAFRLDGHEALSGQTVDILETEAFLAGGHLLFQGSRFTEQAFSQQVSLNTPIALADEYAASIHATIRYYVLHCPYRVAVLITGRYGTKSVPVWTSVESPSFLAEFGPFKDLAGSRLLIAGGKAEPLGDIAQEARSGGTVTSKGIDFIDLRGVDRHFLAEAFFNQFNLFVMVTERKATRLGRKVRIQAV